MLLGLRRFIGFRAYRAKGSMKDRKRCIKRAFGGGGPGSVRSVGFRSQGLGFD